MNTKKRLTAVLLFVSALTCAELSQDALAQSEADRVFIFGDSLSDSGNNYVLLGDTSKAPYLLIPTYPYAIGGHHYTDGKSWAERLAQALNDPAGGKAARDNPGRNGNYAHGGARARVVPGSPIPSSTAQVGMFVGDFGSAPSDALYIVQFGGNDLRDAAVGDPAAAPGIVTAALTDTVTSIMTLYGYGARNFLVANAPGIQYTPAVQLMGPGAVAGVAGLVTFYNLQLEAALQTLDGAPGINIRRLDMAGFLDEIVNSDDPVFSNLASPCLSFMTEFDAKCDDPENHLFWDGIHPTAAAHKLLAERALQSIE